jgi:hypothetical protein
MYALNYGQLWLILFCFAGFDILTSASAIWRLAVYYMLTDVSEERTPSISVGKNKANVPVLD